MPADIKHWVEEPKHRFIKPFIWSPTVASTATGAAGRCNCSLIEIDTGVTAKGIYFYNFATVAGNCRVGIYGPLATEETLLGAPLKCTSADTACAGANAPQYVPFTADTYLNPGRYYLAVIWSDATHTYGKPSASILVTGSMVYYDRAGGYGAFTDPAPANTGTTTNVGMTLLVTN